MSHFNDQLLNLDINVTGRDRELTLPFLQLFYGTAYQKDVEWAIQSLLDAMSNLKRNSLSMELCIRISKFLYDKKTNKLRIKDFWEELKENQDFGDYKVDGKKEWIESADYGEITTKKIATEVKNNYKAVFKHGRTGNEWKIDIDAIIGRAQTYLYDKTKIKTAVIADSGEGCEGCEGFFKVEADNFFKINTEEDADEDIPKGTLEQKLIELWVIVQKLEQDNQQTRKESESNKSTTKDGTSRVCK